jgi:hypothetical protein
MTPPLTPPTTHPPATTGADAAGKMYARRDIEALSDLYTRHLEAITREDLSKRDIAAELAYRDAELAAMRASLVACRAALERASDERYEFLKQREVEATYWKSEGDLYGWNFHQGMAAGANWCDIFYRRIVRTLDAAALADAGRAGTTGG